MKLNSFILLFLLVVLTGCTGNTSIPESHGRTLINIWENGNIQDLGKIMAQDAVYIAAQQNRTYKGIKEIGGYVGHVKLFARDLKIEVISVSSSKTTSVLEWIMTGIQDKPIEGIINVATNRKFSLKGVSVVEVKDGLIVKSTDYMDVLGFVIQLGARVELPGGVVLEMK